MPTVRDQRYELTPVNEVRPHPDNAKQGDTDAIGSSIDRTGFYGALVVQRSTGYILVGNHRWKAAKAKGLADLPVIFVDCDADEARRIMVADNRTSDLGTYDNAKLIELLSGFDGDFAGSGYTDEDLAALLGGEVPPAESIGSTSLVDRFVIPPFSVLDARSGTWRERKAAWLSLGIVGELGRPGGLARRDESSWVPDYYEQKRDAEQTAGRTLDHPEFKAEWLSVPNGGLAATGTSAFDPVLCELAYRWFCPVDGRVLDPFAGGSVRGVVAAALGRKYSGVELSGEQVEANRQQWDEIRPRLDRAPKPSWTQGDSREVLASGAFARGIKFDFVFSCPPYADLERYSDDPADISAMPYPEFRDAYRDIIDLACRRLADDSFACFVVGEARDRGHASGAYHHFVPDTIGAFRDAGLDYYNEAILLTMAGSVPLLVSRQFTASRKIGKIHQNVLVFVKGDPKKATAKIGDPEFGDPLGAMGAVE